MWIPRRSGYDELNTTYLSYLYLIGTIIVLETNQRNCTTDAASYDPQTIKYTTGVLARVRLMISLPYFIEFLPDNIYGSGLAKPLTVARLRILKSVNLHGRACILARLNFQQIENLTRL